MTQRFLTT